MLTNIYGHCCFASSSQGSLLSSLLFALIGSASNLGEGEECHAICNSINILNKNKLLHKMSFLTRPRMHMLRT